MPYIWIDPEIVLERNHITIYKTYRNDNHDDPRTYRFTTNPAGTEDDDPAAFDIRDLNAYKTAPDGTELFDILIAAIDAGEIKMIVIED